MSIDVFAMKCASLAEARIVGFRGTESLSRPFEIDLFFTVPAGTDVRPAVGARASLLADRQDDRGPMAWHGVLARIRLLRHAHERVLYQALLVPKLWLLRHSVRSRVYTKASEQSGANKVEDFVADTLRHGGLVDADFAFHLNESAYPDEELVIQYRESHLDFVHRWLEREGIYYYFEQPPAEGGEEKLRLVDHKSRHEPLQGEGKIWYFPSGSADASAGEGLFELYADYERLPASVLLTDYNYENPAAPVSGSGTVSASGQGELRDYGCRVFDEAQATRLAGIKAQSIGCRATVVHARGNAMFLRPGYRFEIEDAPDEVPKKCLAIEVQHAGALSSASEEVRRLTGLEGNETYRVELRAIDAEVQFRAAQSTPWPRIYGFENGTISGEADSPYAQIDDQGRYHVRFKFDASDLPEGKASCWVRMMQPHGGTTEGFHFPLRKGTEVMLAFLGGDPDRPFIAGVVPNAQRKSPVTGKNHTHNEIRTGGGTHVIVDDADGQQYVDIYTPVKNTQIHMGGPGSYELIPPPTDSQTLSPTTVETTFFMGTEGTTAFKVGGEWWQNVAKDYFVDVQGSARLHYRGTHILNVGSNSTEIHHADRKNDITGKFEQTVGAGGKQEVTGAWLHKVSGKSSDDYGSWETQAKGGWTLHNCAGVTWTIGANGVTITAPKVEINSPDVTIQGAEVKTKSSSWYKGWSGNSMEFFGSKTGVGVHSTSVVAVKADATMMKLETVGFTIGNWGLKKEFKGVDLSQAGVDSGTKGISLWKGAVRTVTFGLVKVG